MRGRDDLPSAPTYRAMVLGPFEVERDGVPLEAASWQQRVQTLFKLLVTESNRQRRRDDLIDLMWPEAHPDSASGNLRILVHRLRLTLGGDPSPVLSHNGWVTLNPAYRWELDLEEMEAAVARAHGDPRRIEAALSMTRGEPFAENRYDDWAIPFVERARQVWRVACMQLAEAHKARGHDDEAAIWLSRLLEADPYDEEALRGLMSVHIRSGKPLEALRQYDLFRVRLANELDVEPSPETEALVDAIRSNVDMEAEAGPDLIGQFIGNMPVGDLIARDEELEGALLIAGAAESGTGRLLMVSGEAGVGKSRLAHEIMLHVRGHGSLVIAARCYAREQSVPFSAVLDLLRQLYVAGPPAIREEVAEKWHLLQLLLPHLGTSPWTLPQDDTDEQYALFRQCAAFLVRAARDRPLAVFLDDLQWADDGSLQLVRYLARELRGHRVFLLAAFRDDDISRDHPLNVCMREMVREGIAERIFLGRLGPDGTARLVRALIDDGQVPMDFLEFAYRHTRGNPELVKRLVHALAGRYKLLREIGAGGMGRVFAAIDERTQEFAAVKLMFARSELDPKALLRFQQEGALLAGLHHPNIVQVRSTFVEEQAGCIVMELLEGRSLAELLVNGPLPLDRAKNICLQILSALEIAHERGIIHRDLKPANVMVLEDDRVKVLDFGIARLARAGTDTSLTSTGMTLGTPLYMAPEQIHGDRLDARADLYAVGAVLYEAVTGRPPFKTDDPLAVAYMQVNELPVPPRARRAGLPSDWDSVILRALAKYPADRFQSATAMGKTVASLPTVEEQNPGQAASPSPEDASDLSWRGLSQSRGPRRISGVLGGVGALALIGAAALGFRLFTPAPVQPVAFHGPDAVASDANGNLYVSDQGNNRVVELSAAGRKIGTWGTFGTGSLQFNAPGSLAVGPGGTIDVVDVANRRIEVLRRGRLVDEDERNVRSIAFDRQQHLFASDFKDHVIFEFGSNWQLLRTMDVPFIHAGRQPFPAGMSTDRQGNLYVPDRLDNRIVKLSPAGRVMGIFGHYGLATAPGGVPAFDLPTGIAVDAGGRMYVADTRNYRIEILSAAGRVIRAITLSNKPVSVTIDPHGNLYVAEYFDNRVLKLSPQGKVLWTAGGA